MLQANLFQQNEANASMKYSFVFVLLFIPFILASQNRESDTTYVVFYYPDGNKSSEGFLVHKMPDGYWKTYFETGTLKSEGNRKNFELDSLWKFYDESGNLTLEINYQKGKKQGERVTYLSDEIIRENFEQDIKTGLTNHFDLKGRLIKSIPFVKGLEEGVAKNYDTLGIVNELITYKRGYIVNRERINRRDTENRPHGLWKWFYEDDVLKAEGSFKNGLKNGIFREYDIQGNLKKIEKYVDDVRQESAEEVARLEIRRDYYPGGKVKVEATYRKGVPEGIRREFDEKGEVVQSYIFRNGIIVGQGIINAGGLKQGYWKEYYANGMLKSQGNYSNDKRVGEWEFFYPKGEPEQKGSYNEEGKPIGKWFWYYSNGQLLREENYRNGLRDGLMTEYDFNRNILAKGDFIDDKEEGFWTIQNGFQREEGEFIEGYRNGLWKHFYEDGTLAFEGSFVEDNPNGKHISYYSDGKKQEEGSYIMGRKNGEWKKWNEDGSLLIVISYVNGIERSYDGIQIPDDEIIIPD
ncbi:MAG: hypothetical protein CVT92_10085 [Bacteroidetes bacterium HGW-Bacteroidetes-1]|nr:MAG: hypothetical protein CVT92_10085 [Bacteroidetes bacterium HGW-Bacteroidetes-1]